MGDITKDTPKKARTKPELQEVEYVEYEEGWVKVLYPDGKQSKLTKEAFAEHFEPLAK